MPRRISGTSRLHVTASCFNLILLFSIFVMYWPYPPSGRLSAPDGFWNWFISSYYAFSKLLPFTWNKKIMVTSIQNCNTLLPIFTFLMLFNFLKGALLFSLPCCLTVSVWYWSCSLCSDGCSAFVQLKVYIISIPQANLQPFLPPLWIPF